MLSPNKTARQCLSVGWLVRESAGPIEICSEQQQGGGGGDNNNYIIIINWLAPGPLPEFQPESGLCVARASTGDLDRLSVGGARAECRSAFPLLL